MELTFVCMTPTVLAQPVQVTLEQGLALDKHKVDLAEDKHLLLVSQALPRKLNSQVHQQVDQIKVHQQVDQIKAPPLWMYQEMLLKMEIKAPKTLGGLCNQMEHT